MTKTLDFSLGGVSKVFREQQEAGGSRRIITVPIAELHQHPRLQVEVLYDNYLDELVESIKHNGILEEPRVFPDPDNGGYWLVSGRHRVKAATLAGYTEIDCIVDDSMTVETAEIAITDSNLRHELTVLEKAWTLRIKREAEKRQGYRSDLHGEQQSEIKESEGTVRRYIRLTYLIPDLQDMTELEGKQQLKIRTGAELSYLPEDLQQVVADCIGQYGKMPDAATAEEWRLECEDIETLTEENIRSWFENSCKPKKKPVKISLKPAQIAQFVPPEYTTAEVNELVLRLLRQWARERKDINLPSSGCEDSIFSSIKDTERM